jgi:pentatricopeptide repeat protein
MNCNGAALGSFANRNRSATAPGELSSKPVLPALPASDASHDDLLRFLVDAIYAQRPKAVAWSIAELGSKRSVSSDAALQCSGSNISLNASATSTDAGLRNNRVLEFGLWHSAMHASFPDIASGLTVLRVGEQLLPAASLRRSAYVPAISALCREHQWNTLCDLYTSMWVRHEINPISAPDERLVMLAANFAVDSGRVQIAAKLIQQMESHGVPLTLYSYAVLLKGYGRAKKIHAVTRTLASMHENKLPFDRITFNSAVDAYVRCGDLEAARSIVDEPKNAILRDSRTFNTLLKGIARHGNVAAAFRVRDEIIAAGLVPNEVTQNTLIDVCVRVGDFKAALKLASDLAPGPGSVRTNKPDQDNQLTIALSRVIAGLADSGNLHDAIELLEKMERRGAPPNHITYCSLINACMRRNLVPKAHSIFTSMKVKSGLSPTLEVYNSMIAGLCKVGNEFNVDAAVRMLRDMRKTYADQERSQRSELVSAEDDVGAPAAFTQTTPRNARDTAYSTSSARWLAKSTAGAAKCVRPSDLTYNAVMDGLVRYNRVYEAQDVHEWMREDGVLPTVVTYTTLIKGWSAEREFVKARREFQSMSKDGILPDRLALNAFINACARSDKFAVADQILVMMEKDEGETDISPDVYSYSPLVATYVRRGNLDAAWKLYVRGRENGMQMSPYMADMMVNAVVTLGVSTLRHGQATERQKVADIASTILDHVWQDIRDLSQARAWRRKLLALFMNSATALREQVANAGGSGALRPASERIFKEHGWNKIDSGWRAL